MQNRVRECWDESAPAWADFVRTGKDLSRECFNNPATFAMLGDIAGKDVLDLACGEGYNTRLMARKGARMTGIDYSERMIGLALEEERREPLGIQYRCTDATNMKDIPDSAFDIVTCLMVYMDFEDIEDVTREITRVLKPRGFVIISMPHPCFEMSWQDGRKTAGWVYENDADPTNRGKALYVKQADYFRTGRYEIDWNMPRLKTHFRTISFKRTLTDYVGTLGRHGLYVSDLVEPKPSMEALAKDPSSEKHLRVPESIIFKAVKVRD